MSFTCSNKEQKFVNWAVHLAHSIHCWYRTKYYWWELMCSHRMTTKEAALTGSILGGAGKPTPASDCFDAVSSQETGFQNSFMEDCRPHIHPDSFRTIQPRLQLSPALPYHTDTGQQMLQLAIFRITFFFFFGPKVLSQSLKMGWMVLVIWCVMVVII